MFSQPLSQLFVVYITRDADWLFLPLSSFPLSPSDWLACSLWLAGMGALASIAYIPKRDWIEEREKGAIADSKKRT